VEGGHTVIEGGMVLAFQVDAEIEMCASECFALRRKEEKRGEQKQEKWMGCREERVI
jgi:hypothetical protein